MDLIDTATTIGAMVAQRPGRSRIFQKLGIDFCCGGKKSLSEVCREKGLDPQSVLQVLLASEEVDHAGGEVDAAKMALADLCDHVEQTHHAYLKQELPRLYQMVHKVANVHGDRCPWMRDVLEVYVPFMDELTHHMEKEERDLFPLIRALDAGDTAGAAADSGTRADSQGKAVAASIEMMEHEHDSAGDALLRIRQLTDDFTPPLGACNTFRATLDALAELESDMHQHVHKENNVLFPRALEREGQSAGIGAAAQ